jgi:asparagine synthetase B (glutamine-hydrolysing)
MCGIIGGISKHSNGFTYKDVEAIEQLLYIDALRGEDSTGIAVFYNDGSMQQVKDVTPASYFLTEATFHNVKQRLVATGKAIIGHNRKKTMGGSDVKSAHPFEINNNVLFVHNGTLTNVPDLKKNLHTYLEKVGVVNKKLTPDTEVDSHYLGTLLGMCYGDPRKIERVLENISGAYACVWMDQEKETLHILKNKERPLYLAYTDSGFFWASEAGFLYAVLPRNGIKVDKIEAVKDDTLMTIRLAVDAPTSFTEETLVIKKQQPQGVSKPLGATNGLSKKAFKTFCNKWLNKQGSFFLDDFVESGESFYVWGEIEDPYGIKCMCRAALYGVPEDVLYAEWFSSLVSGQIVRIGQDTKTGLPILYFKDLKLIPKSLH